MLTRGEGEKFSKICGLGLCFTRVFGEQAVGEGSSLGAPGDGRRVDERGTNVGRLLLCSRRMAHYMLRSSRRGVGVTVSAGGTKTDGWRRCHWWFFVPGVGHWSRPRYSSSHFSRHPPYDDAVPPGGCRGNGRVICRIISTTLA